MNGLLGGMTETAWRRWRPGRNTPWLVAALVLTVALAALPPRWLVPARDAMGRALAPGQRAATIVRTGAREAAARLAAHFASARRLAQAEADRRRLAEDNARLAAELAALRAALAETAARRADGEDSLGAGRTRLEVRTLVARVLGRQARAYLARRDLLDVGGRLGVEPDTLVADAVPLMDLGAVAGVRPGQLVVEGHCLWGKVAEVGARLSTLRRVTEPGFRDVVELIDPDRSRAARRPRGLLEGTGQPLARVRWVDVTEPVAEGDLVCSAALEGIADEPLIYGRVARAEQPVGAGCWEIWMEPALRGAPGEVCLLVVEADAAPTGPDPRATDAARPVPKRR